MNEDVVRVLAPQVLGIRRCSRRTKLEEDEPGQLAGHGLVGRMLRKSS